jgi:peroxiredoxin
MALTHAPPPELGQACPDFNLPGTDGAHHSRQEFAGAQASLVMFICNHCPYVIAIEDRLVELARSFAGKSVKIMAISSNDTEKYAADSFENMRKKSSEKKYPFPYLYDESQAIAKAFGAVCTPDFFLYDSKLKLQYRGRLDDSWKDALAVQSQELKTAIEALLRGEVPSQHQKSSMGCNIKWKPENLT